MSTKLLPSPRAFKASSSSGDSAVRLATTRMRAMARRLVRRQIRVPVAQRPKRAPELALGGLVVQGGVDVRAPQRLTRGRQPLDLTRLGVETAAERHSELVELAQRRLAHDDDDPR